MASRRQGNIERKTILSLNKLLNAIVQVRDQADTAVIDAAIDSAAAAAESLKQLYIADRQERKARHESMGNFDVED